MIETALILAGGKGTRLREVTQDTVPKPLVEVLPGITMLDLTIAGLLDVGVDTIVLSISHLRQQMLEYIHQHYADWNLDVLVEDEELGTGGSIRNFIQQGQNMPFVITPADHYLEWDSTAQFLAEADSYLPDALLYWAVTYQDQYSQVRKNLWIDRLTGQIVHCTTGQPEEQRRQIDQEMRGLERYVNLTSAGIVTINSSNFAQETAQLTAPFCLYKYILPVWVEQGLPVFAGLVDTDVIDMGTPERLAVVREMLNGGYDASADRTPWGHYQPS